MIVSGGVSSFVFSLQSDRKAMKERMVEVSDSFEEFSADTSLFEEFRDELYTNYLSNLYYNTLYQDDALLKNKLSNYENMVDQLEKQANGLADLCDDVYYPDTNVNNKCSNYKGIYEQINNYFVTDINLYNKNIKDYNNYQKSNNSNEIVKEYKTDRKYIDYNEDKVYDGKEE